MIIPMSPSPSWLALATSADARSVPRTSASAPPMSAVGSGLSQHRIAMPSGTSRLRANVTTTGSIWRDTSADLYSDPRARHVGDSVTVKISIEDEASLDSSSDRSRAATRDFSFGINYDVGLGGFKRSGSGNGNRRRSIPSRHTKAKARPRVRKRSHWSWRWSLRTFLPNGNHGRPGQPGSSS